MKILITGAEGQLGQTLLKLSDTNHFTLIGLNRSECDITNPDNIQKQFEKHEPDFVINTAAYTAVDKAETEPDLVYAINRDGPLNLANICEKNQIPFIHVSTDYVFDGHTEKPYQENDLTNPISVYGKSKLAGEQAIQSINQKHIILRVSGVFSPYRQNFVKTIFKLSQEKSELRIVTDQNICPTDTKSIAEALLIICKKIPEVNTPWGIYHFCSAPQTNWYEFTKYLVAQVKTKNELESLVISPITSAEFHSAAQRPKFSVLNCEKINNYFSLTQPDWKGTVKNVLETLMRKSHESL